MGRRLIPRPVFDYVDGGADEELSMAGNVRAFRRWRFQPRALPEITTVDTSARLLDRDLPLPLALAPTGYTRMMHPGGEIAAARAAQRHGLPYALSTMATTTIEDLAASGRARSVVPAVHPARQRDEQGPGGPGRGGRVPGAHGHRGHHRHRAPDQGPEERAGDPARAHRPDAGQHRRQARLLGPDAAQRSRSSSPTSPGTADSPSTAPATCSTPRPAGTTSPCCGTGGRAS